MRYFLLKNSSEARKELLQSNYLLLEPQYKKYFDSLDNCDCIVNYYSVLDEKLLGRFMVRFTPQELDNLMDVSVPEDPTLTLFCEVEFIRKVGLSKARLLQFKFIETAAEAITTIG